MAYSGFKGIGPNKIGCGNKGASSPAKKHLLQTPQKNSRGLIFI